MSDVVVLRKRTLRGLGVLIMTLIRLRAGPVCTVIALSAWAVGGRPFLSPTFRRFLESLAKREDKGHDMSRRRASMLKALAELEPAHAGDYARMEVMLLEDKRGAAE